MIAFKDGEIVLKIYLFFVFIVGRTLKYAQKVDKLYLSREKHFRRTNRKQSVYSGARFNFSFLFSVGFVFWGGVYFVLLFERKVGGRRLLSQMLAFVKQMSYLLNHTRNLGRLIFYNFPILKSSVSDLKHYEMSYENCIGDTYCSI